MRRDLADIRLAQRVFAPHYAMAVKRTVASAVALRGSAGANGEVVAQLIPGDTFEVLEFSSGQAWGIAVDRQLVGYIDSSALAA